MKKRSFQKQAFFGVLAGILTLQNIHAEQTSSTSQNSNSQTSDDANEGNLGYHLMTEDELLLELNDEGYRLYMSLNEEGKKLAREVASSRCDHTNLCKGLNACKTDKNDCAGKGECKGKGKCAISDKNLAVKLVAKKMAEKRAKAEQSPAKY